MALGSAQPLGWRKLATVRSCAVVKRKFLGFRPTAHRAPVWCAVGASEPKRGQPKLAGPIGGIGTGCAYVFTCGGCRAERESATPAAPADFGRRTRFLVKAALCRSGIATADGPGDFRGDITAEDGPNDSADRNTALHEEAVRAAIGRDEIGDVATNYGADDTPDEDAGNPNNPGEKCQELR